MNALKVPVLTYHAYNVTGNDYASNDHIALAEDLKFLSAEGRTVVPLESVVKSLFYSCDRVLPERSVCITLDDGTDLDWTDVEFGGLGVQRSMAGILSDWHRNAGQSILPNATTFVIASPNARASLAEKALSYGHGMGEEWWLEAQSSGILSIGNHSWDHCHPLADPEASNHFFDVDTLEKATLQVCESAEYIARRCASRPLLFAYPWGQASDFLRYEYFPNCGHQHRTIAALTTEPEPITRESDRWYLPRYVCGEHWSSTEELAHVLKL